MAFFLEVYSCPDSCPQKFFLSLFADELRQENHQSYPPPPQAASLTLLNLLYVLKTHLAACEDLVYLLV